MCATWWWTGRTDHANNQICTDGSPGGYGVWEITGKELKWQYKSIGYDRDYQFRAYDMNTVLVNKSSHAPGANATHTAMVPEYSFGFDVPNANNEILINVWGYDPQWTVSVTENGSPLTVTRVSSHDPLHVISYSMKRLSANATPTFPSTAASHMFKATASSPTSTLMITVTDNFGRAYTETMARPKAFAYTMK